MTSTTLSKLAEPHVAPHLDPEKGRYAMRWHTKRRTNPTIHLHFATLDDLREQAAGMAPHMLRRCTFYQYRDGAFYEIFSL